MHVKVTSCFFYIHKYIEIVVIIKIFVRFLHKKFVFFTVKYLYLPSVSLHQQLLMNLIFSIQVGASCANPFVAFVWAGIGKA